MHTNYNLEKNMTHALNVGFNSATFDPICSRSPPYEGIKFGYSLENVRFLLLSTYQSERLQINTKLLLIITSKLSGCTNIDDLERPWTPKIGAFSDLFRDFRLRRILKDWLFAEITGDRQRQPAYEIKLMLSSVSWAQISWWNWNRQITDRILRY